MSQLIDMTGWKMSEHGVPDSRWEVLACVEWDGYTLDIKKRIESLKKNR